jgi:carboxymethylenebutenolidase
MWNVTREEVQIPVGERGPLPALLTRPLVGGGPAVLVVHDIWGRSPFYEDIAARLAVAGFVALLPDYFAHVSAGPIARGDYDAAFGRRSKLDERATVEQLIESLTWLKSQPGVTGSRVGTLGFCMGGTLVLDVAASRDDVATAAYYAFPAGDKQRSPTHPTPPIELVDKMRGPIIAFWGDQDPLVDMTDVERFRRALADRGVAIDVTIYPGLEHGFLGASRLDPSHAAYDAACDAWTRTLRFFWSEVRPSDARQSQSAGSR